jgi:hypothetical protein
MATCQPRCDMSSYDSDLDHPVGVIGSYRMPSCWFRFQGLIKCPPAAITFRVLCVPAAAVRFRVENMPCSWFYYGSG